MRSKAIVMIGCVSATAVLLAGMPARMSAQESHAGEPRPGGPAAATEFVGQVQNFAPAGPGLPATSIQYGYLSHVEGLSDSQIYLPGVPQNEASALLTFYNDSVTEKVTTHGSLRIVIREGTTTIYVNRTPSGDFTTPKPDSFRQGTPVLMTRWRHQVILDGVPSPDPDRASHEPVLRHLVAHDHRREAVQPWRRQRQARTRWPDAPAAPGGRGRFHRHGERKVCRLRHGV